MYANSPRKLSVLHVHLSHLSVADADADADANATTKWNTFIWNECPNS